MGLVEVRVDPHKPLAEDPGTGHNRWHPAIAPIARCAPGDAIVLDTRDATDGQLTEDSSSADLANIELGRVHPLTGPIQVDGAEPGDLLTLEIEEVTPGPFGYTAIVPGLGLLRDEFPEPFLVRWHLDGNVATSVDLPGVAIPAAPFLGIIGVAPDEALLALATRRESEALARGAACPPPILPAGAVPGGVVARAGLGTVPPRENGGNLDVRQIAPGARVSLPVRVPGAMFSVGDAHFAQGDGEVCGLAVETRAQVRLRVELDRGGAERDGVGQTRLAFVRPPSAERRFVATTGLSISEGACAPEDATAAARNALREMIAYLVGRGCRREQAYVLCSVAADLRISQIVDAPYVTVSAQLPLDIFR